MPDRVRMTGDTVAVLGAILEAPRREHYGFALMQTTRLESGTLYPILARLEKAGWLESRWEALKSGERGRPPRRFYRLRRGAAAAAKQAVAEHAEGSRP